MATEYLDRYGRSLSICHRLPARLKLLLALAVIVAGVSIPFEFWPLQGILASLAFAAHSLARIPLRYLTRRLSLFLPMLLLLSLSLPAAQGFRAGWEMMLTILFRSILAFITLLWLLNVMPFDQLLITLRGLGAPEVLIATLAFMYRYVFVLWDELDSMRIARRARSFGRSGLWFRWNMSAQLVGMLLIRAMSRAERVHGAMLARGWDGRVRSLERGAGSGEL
jgi:cobalt/nickel transport system permease protein